MCIGGPCFHSEHPRALHLTPSSTSLQLSAQLVSGGRIRTGVVGFARRPALESPFIHVAFVSFASASLIPGPNST